MNAHEAGLAAVTRCQWPNHDDFSESHEAQFASCHGRRPPVAGAPTTAEKKSIAEKHVLKTHRDDKTACRPQTSSSMDLL